MAPKKTHKPIQETMVEEPTQDLDVPYKAIREKDSEVRGREDPWLHMKILQGTHRIGIHSKEFRLHFTMQTL
jgi:hypothetical protein